MIRRKTQMAYTHFNDVTDLLDDAGEILVDPAQAKELAEYITDIIFMASYPATEYPPEYIVDCHCHPNHEPCLGKLVGFINRESDDIMWMCSKCVDRGLISNWRGTMWDLSDSGKTFH
jgi:glyoxylase-like metal-dependent hydrolase (beta-lactamase superfamily II)